MPKPKYLYENKKSRYKGQNQEGLDEIFFKSPKYAQIVAKKYGIHTADVERAMKAYFECLKEMNLTNDIHKDKIRRGIDDLEIYLDSSINKDWHAYTDIDNNYFVFRSNSKAGEFSTLFHEFNHFLSGVLYFYYNSEDEGEQKSFLDNPFMAFDEGITEYFARLQNAYYTKKPALLKSYANFTAYVRQLYLTSGNELFKSYLNGGDFRILGKKLKNFGIELEEVVTLAEEISRFGKNKLIKNPTAKGKIDYIDLDLKIQTRLISMFERKMKTEINNGFKKFSNMDDLYDTVFKCYLAYSKSLFFGLGEECITNCNRADIFNELTCAFLNSVEEINNCIKENPEVVDFSFEGYSFDDYEISEIEAIFEKVNDCNYGFVELGEETITLEKMMDKKVKVFDEGHANYFRTKTKFYSKTKKKLYSKTRDMRDDELFDTYYENLSRIVKFEDKQKARYVEEKPKIRDIVFEYDENGEAIITINYDNDETILIGNDENGKTEVIGYDEDGEKIPVKEIPVSYDKIKDILQEIPVSYDKIKDILEEMVKESNQTSNNQSRNNKKLINYNRNVEIEKLFE